MSTAKDPLVSICCITYNHDNYIRDSIEGFLMQKTDFPFEIIIHDDASTDTTAEIIREYERTYPELIKPIYQTENQYSKGERVSLITFKAARGKYIALCEGDDYWTDPMKLQKQVIEMEKHPECHLCIHPAIRRWIDLSREDEVFGLHSKKNSIFSTEDVILGGGGFTHTASIVLNRMAIPRITAFFNMAKDAPMGDYYLQVLGAENGGALYLCDVMSVYRSGVPGSWTEKMNDSSSNWCSLLRKTISCNEKLDVYTNRKYTKYIQKKNGQLYSSLVKSLYVDINYKKSIIDMDMEKIRKKDRFLWNVVYSHPQIVKLMQSVHQFVLNIFVRRNDQRPIQAETMGKPPNHH